MAAGLRPHASDRAGRLHRRRHVPLSLVPADLLRHAGAVDHSRCACARPGARRGNRASRSPRADSLALAIATDQWLTPCERNVAPLNVLRNAVSLPYRVSWIPGNRVGLGCAADGALDGLDIQRGADAPSLHGERILRCSSDPAMNAAHGYA